jgi:hypothetical protein
MSVQRTLGHQSCSARAKGRECRGWDNVISWSGNHHTHLVTKTWLPDALLRGCPSPRARSARGAGCPAPSCDRYDLSKTWVSAARLSRRTHTPRHHLPAARPGNHIVPAQWPVVRGAEHQALASAACWKPAFILHGSFLLLAFVLVRFCVRILKGQIAFAVMPTSTRAAVCAPLRAPRPAERTQPLRKLGRRSFSRRSLDRARKRAGEEQRTYTADASAGARGQPAAPSDPVDQLARG